MKQIMKKLYGACSLLALGILASPADMRLFPVACFFALLALFAVLFYDRWGLRWGLHRPDWYYAAVVLFYFAVRFITDWQLRPRMRVLLGTLHLPVLPGLIGIALVLGLLALPSADSALHALGGFLQRRLGKSARGTWLLQALCVAAVLVLQLAMLQSSASDTILGVLAAPAVLALNLLLLLAFNALLALPLGSLRRAMSVGSVLVVLWGIANYYTLQFHGSPLYFSELVNARTAAAVAGGYRYSLSVEIAEVLLVGIFALVFLHRSEALRSTGRPTLTHLGVHAAVLAVSVLLSWALAGGVLRNVAGWMPWNLGIETNGFPVMLLSDVQEKRRPFLEPAGYDAASLPDCPAPDTAEDSGRRPDIILILNETFCDLNVYTELDTDADALAALYGIEDIRSGSAIVPKVGGGTNDSEFELLMSKSSYLVKGNSPFTFLWDYQLGRSVVQHLAALGYSSAGMHCEIPENYNRNVAYPLLGFDRVLLGEESFSEKDFYGDRPWTDDENYRDLIACYESMDPDAPRFVYLLTYQNHGGYEKNVDSLDTVHTARDLGALTDDVNEYLSSLRLSAEAFARLIDYYRSSERDVILCMVGDHAPPFIINLPAREEWSAEELSIRQRTVPYFIWANFELEEQAEMETVSMPDLVPLTLKLAGLPLTPFYRCLLRLHELLPVRTSTGVYRDAAGEIGIFSPANAYYQLLNDYYCLEYNSLQKAPEYRAALFELQAEGAPGS